MKNLLAGPEVPFIIFPITQFELVLNSLTQIFWARKQVFWATSDAVWPILASATHFRGHFDPRWVCGSLGAQYSKSVTISMSLPQIRWDILAKQACQEFGWSWSACGWLSCQPGQSLDSTGEVVDSTGAVMHLGNTWAWVGLRLGGTMAWTEPGNWNRGETSVFLQTSFIRTN